MKDQTRHTSTNMNLSENTIVEDNVLDRDKPGPVSVSPAGQEKPSYTYNGDKSDPIDPHLSDNNPPGSSLSFENTEDNALDRDKPGPVSVSPEGSDKPSYTYNADKTDAIDPHLANMSS